MISSRVVLVSPLVLAFFGFASFWSPPAMAQCANPQPMPLTFWFKITASHSPTWVGVTEPTAGESWIPLCHGWNGVYTLTSGFQLTNWQYVDSWPIYTDPQNPPQWWPPQQQPSPWFPGTPYPISKNNVNYFWDEYFDALAPGKYVRIQEPSLTRNCHGYTMNYSAWLPSGLLGGIGVLVQDDYEAVNQTDVLSGNIVLPDTSPNNYYHSVKVDAVHTSTIYLFGHPITFRHPAQTTEKQGSSGVYQRSYASNEYDWAPPTLTETSGIVRYFRKR